MTYNYLNWEITATYTGSKQADWENINNWNHHRVTVTNTNNGKEIGFDFWASLAHPHLTSLYDTVNAFHCFVEDAISGDMDFEEFCFEFGYDTDSRRAERTWKACKKAAEKLRRIYDGDFYELAEKLRDFS